MFRLAPAVVVIAIAATGAPQPADERIAAIESALYPFVIVRGETLETTPLAERMRQLGIPAVSVAVIDGGELAWAKAYGFADKDENVPATAETLFQAASISKPVAALAALKLVEDDRLDLDANVNDVLTAWRIPDDEFTVDRKVTLRRLLNHSAGTTVWGFSGYENGVEIPSTIEVLDGAGNSEAVRVFKAPGESWRYSGGGYTVLQRLLTEVTNEPFPDVMTKLVLGPLAMMSSTYEQPLPSAWRSRAASGYDGAGVRVSGRWRVHPEMAAAGLWTTPTDLAKYIVEVQRAYAGNGRVLSAATARAMLEPGMNDHGLGPIIEGAGRRFGHSGVNAGFRAVFTAFIEGGSGVVVMTNSDNGTDFALQLIATIARAYAWPDLAPQEKTLAVLDASAYERLVGRYDVPQLGEVYEITYEGGRLYVKGKDKDADEWGPSDELRPESDLRFFEREYGTNYEFVVADGEVTGFMWLVGPGIRGQRVVE